jgi:hypothetical protein
VSTLDVDLPVRNSQRAHRPFLGTAFTTDHEPLRKELCMEQQQFSDA